MTPWNQHGVVGQGRARVPNFNEISYISLELDFFSLLVKKNSVAHEFRPNSNRIQILVKIRQFFDEIQSNLNANFGYLPELKFEIAEI